MEPGTTKNSEGREFPFQALPALADLLRRQRERTTAIEKTLGRVIPCVFHRKGKPIGEFRKAWETACEAGKVPHRLFHDFRRTAVRNLVRAAVPERVAMELTGHRTRSIFDRYHIVSPGDLKEAVGKLAAFHESRQPAAAPQHQVVPLKRSQRARRPA